MWDKYITATNINEVLDLVANPLQKARIIAGGTDLYLEMTREQPTDVRFLIDISRIQELKSINQNENGDIVIGAAVTHNQIVSSPLLRNNARCLAEASYQVGSPQIRNMGTVVGNLVTASPANDTIPALVALGAILTLLSKTHTRSIMVEDFYTGVRKTVLQKDEIVREIIIPAESTHGTSNFQKLGLRNAQSISVTNIALWLLTENDRISQARVAVGSVAPTVIRLKSIEKELLGLQIDEIKNIKLSSGLITEINPISDLRGSATYRHDMVMSLLQHSFETINNPGKHGKPVPELPITLDNSNTIMDQIIIDKEALSSNNCHLDMIVNGKKVEFVGEYKNSLLNFLREECGQIGVKEGCGEGECGSCTVIMNGKAVLACLIPAPMAQHAVITTIEGLRTNGTLHPLQKSFIEESAVQCGYCTPGFILAAKALLDGNDNPDTDQIKEAISGNLCRCTGYYKIIKAIEKASGGNVR